MTPEIYPEDPERFKKPMTIPTGRGFKVERSITILKPAAVLFSFWRNLENLPRFMPHLESVTAIDDKKSMWVVKGPAGSTFEWEAEIIGEHENEMIAWRSLEGSDINTAGSVWFRPAPGARGTEVRVVLKYETKGGSVTNLLAKI